LALSTTECHETVREIRCAQEAVKRAADARLTRRRDFLSI
jgi:hypothetical protein